MADAHLLSPLAPLFHFSMYRFCTSLHINCLLAGAILTCPNLPVAELPNHQTVKQSVVARSLPLCQALPSTTKVHQRLRDPAIQKEAKKTHRPSTIRGAIHPRNLAQDYPILTIHPLTAVQGTSQRGHQPATKGQRRRALINLRRRKYKPLSSRNRQLSTGIAVGATRSIRTPGSCVSACSWLFFFFARQTQIRLPRFIVDADAELRPLRPRRSLPPSFNT